MPITLLDIMLIVVMLALGLLGFARGLIFLEWLLPQSSRPIVSVFIDLLAVVSRRWRLGRFERKYHASIA
jgi:hypothetical protein